ncbi:hypothetical protein GJ699_29850 [Duganella sp. FT80W]|uniref:Uncharacterized protein n=1 Tax=Duganella guangzhouensis TaxID=2666084 RepID=A0A6I2L7H5_9BURK|nr:hypothetical protein [Duganella guangzhouensis]MRW94185.1 hypothetical protein [Duganella guangzhouensis]
MATSIDSVSQLVKVIQSQLTQRAATPTGQRKAPPSTPAGAPARYAQEQLGALIGQRVRQIGRDDPQRGRKAFRVFLEAVLLSHFGERLINDPRFFQMVDDIQLAMERDVACNELVNRAIQQLLGEP